MCGRSSEVQSGSRLLLFIVCLCVRGENSTLMVYLIKSMDTFMDTKKKKKKKILVNVKVHESTPFTEVKVRKQNIIFLFMQNGFFFLNFLHVYFSTVLYTYCTVTPKHRHSKISCSLKHHLLFILNYTTAELK